MIPEPTTDAEMVAVVAFWRELRAGDPEGRYGQAEAAIRAGKREAQLIALRAVIRMAEEFTDAEAATWTLIAELEAKHE